jgi:arylsulfate sulfotransferase
MLIPIPAARRRSIPTALAVLALCVLMGCNDSGPYPSPPPLAQGSTIGAVGSLAGATPFTSFVELKGNNIVDLSSITYTIEPKPGTASRPVSVSYTTSYLGRRGYLGGTQVLVPVFGLYAGYSNHVNFVLSYRDASRREISIDILTAPYADPKLDGVTVLKKRDADVPLGFNFFAMKPQAGSPIIIDTDGNVRWVGESFGSSVSTMFRDNAFFIGDSAGLTLRRVDLDGTVQESHVLSPTFDNFHHNIDRGKHGLLIELNTVVGGVRRVASTLADVSTSGVVLKEWDLTDIFRDYMLAHGDDPSTLVRPNVDWLHTNGAIYDPSDDTVIVSGRETFLVKIAYETGEIIWILGDPEKHWYTFPSLRAKAVTLPPGDLYPIGQHAPSITADGLLMVFNNGAPSFNHAVGTAAGQSRTYSAVSAYRINPATFSGQEVRRFDYGQSILSDICSSAYEGANGSVLVNYAVAAGRTKARLVGLDASQSVIFDLEYPTSSCATSWNAIIVPLDALEFR